MSQTAIPAERGRLYVLVLRILGSAGRWWPVLLVGAVAYLGWEELRRIDLNQVRHALHSLSGVWLLVACALTLLNLALLGCYDLVTLEGSPVRLNGCAAGPGRGRRSSGWRSSTGSSRPACSSPSSCPPASRRTGGTS